MAKASSVVFSCRHCSGGASGGVPQPCRPQASSRSTAGVAPQAYSPSDQKEKDAKDAKEKKAGAKK